MRTLVLAAFAAVSMLLSLDGRSAVALTITVDHKNGSQTVDRIAEVAPGDIVGIDIVNTAPLCFTYNAEQVVKGAGALDRDRQIPLETVHFETAHQRNIGSYKITAAKRAGAPKECESLGFGDKTWTVVVNTLGWTIGASGGLVVDGLVDKKYFLRNGTTIARDRNAEDRSNQRLGLYLHLVNTEWARHNNGWVPLSVGIGQDDKTRYMLGTSYRFGEDWFVTAGAITGKSASLPVGLSEGDTVTNANALQTMGQRSTTSWFISVSFGFLGDKAMAGFKGVFEPKPATTK